MVFTRWDSQTHALTSLTHSRHSLTHSCTSVTDGQTRSQYASGAVFQRWRRHKIKTNELLKLTHCDFGIHASSKTQIRMHDFVAESPERLRICKLSSNLRRTTRQCVYLVTLVNPVFYASATAEKLCRRHTVTGSVRL